MTEGQIPPHDAESEAAVLSAAILDAKAAARAASMLRPEDFYLEPHRRVFEACRALSEAGAAPDVVQIGAWLRDRDRLTQIGGMPYLTRLLDSAPAITNVAKYANVVRLKSRVRATIAACQKVTAMGYVGHGDDREFLAMARSEVAQASSVSDTDVIVSNVESLKSIVRRMVEARERGQMVTGIPTGIGRYDRMTLGLHGTHLTIVGARPGNGKSSWGAGIAETVAASGIGVLFFSLEMLREELLVRLISSRAGIDSRMLQVGYLSPRQWEHVTEAAQHLSKIPLWIDETSGLTMTNIRERCLGAIDESATHSTALGLVVIDYLQKIAIPAEDARKKGRYEQVGDIARGCKALAKELKVPVVALAQLNRGAAQLSGKRPTMELLRESGDIEQEADVITLIHWPHKYDKEEPADVSEFLVEKARHGSTGLVRVRWEPQYTRFRDLPDGDESDEELERNAPMAPEDARYGD